MGAPTARRRKRDAKAALAAAKLPERSVELCLRGDLVAELQELQRELADAEQQEKAGGSLDGGRPREVAEKIQALREEMVEHTIVLTMHALPRRQWAALVAAHPPRDGDDTDRIVGYNLDSLMDELLRKCVVDPVLTDEEWDRLDEVLADGQWKALTNAALAVNIRDVSVPFSARASQILASSAPE